jgi:hypothetical protein
MPLPLSKIRRVGDYDGRWWLCLRCRYCGHVGEIPAQVLVARYGVRAMLADVIGTVSCRQSRNKHCPCQGKNFEALCGIGQMRLRTERPASRRLVGEDDACDGMSECRMEGANRMRRYRRLSASASCCYKNLFRRSTLPSPITIVPHPIEANRRRYAWKERRLYAST